MGNYEWAPATDDPAYWASLDPQLEATSNGAKAHVQIDDTSAFRITIQTARELCERPDPEGDDLLLGPLLIRQQRTIIGGDTGAGKTTMAIGIVGAYVQQNTFLGFTGVGGKALVLDLEQGERTAKKRLREAGLDQCDDVDYALIPDGLTLDQSKAHRDELQRLFNEGEYGVVLLDPHYKAHEGDTNDEKQTKALMKHLDRWRAHYAFALMLPTHARKPPVTGRINLTIHDIASGSGAIVRGAENVFGIERGKPGTTKFYGFKYRDGDDVGLPEINGDPWTLLFSKAEGYRRIDTHTGARKAPANAIVIWIRAHGGKASPGEIRDHFEISDSTLRERRPELAEQGIEYRGQGKEAAYVDHNVYPSLDPAIRPRDAPRDESWGDDFAGSNGLEQHDSTPSPRDPAIQTASGSETALKRQNTDPATPRFLKEVAPPAGGHGPTSYEREDE